MNCKHDRRLAAHEERRRTFDTHRAAESRLSAEEREAATKWRNSLALSDLPTPQLKTFIALLSRLLATEDGK